MTMDSAYISDIVIQVRRYKWGMTMVGTAQVNQTGADAKATFDNMHKKSKGTHEPLR